MRRGDYTWAYLMIAPTMLGTLLFHIWPVLQSVYLSFTTWNSFGNYKWSGLDNYRRMAHDAEVWSSLGNTVVFTLITVPVGLALSTIAAVLLNQKIRGIPVYRTLYFLPVITMPAAIAMVWKWLYNGDFGLLNELLGLFSSAKVQWLTNPGLALYSTAAVAVWSAIGYNMIIILSGLQGIPSHLYEAASMDGAGGMRKFFSITLPMLSPTFFFLSVISIISTLQTFELVFMMIGANSPVIGRTQTIVYDFFKYAFLMNDKGYATSIAMLLFAIILVVTVIQFRVQKKWVHYE
ncbi:carbohydrate ABC transporter permease [Paenibacillus humicola]|uniref:carbohydrate ABC transporter permease n=1 Tax=Paenibacillus humicola TaxID=3110540 RepID=UPI00237B4F5E|nr:sugar ABC transporter permease [Paenibacillus humicola]